MEPRSASPRIVHSQKTNQLVGRNAIGVLRLDERRQSVGQLHFGLEDVEARHGARFVAILLVFDLLLQQRHVLLLGDDQRAIEDDLVKLVDDLRDNVVDRRAKAEKRAVVSCDSAFDAIIRRAAVEDELGALKLNVPALILNREAALLKTIRSVGRRWELGISPMMGLALPRPLVVNASA